MTCTFTYPQPPEAVASHRSWRHLLVLRVCRSKLLEQPLTIEARASTGTRTIARSIYSERASGTGSVTLSAETGARGYINAITVFFYATAVVQRVATCHGK